MNSSTYMGMNNYFQDSYHGQTSRVYQEVAAIKAELTRNNMELLIKFLQYRNEFKVSNEEIIDINLHSQYAKREDDVESYTIVEEMQKESRELDPSKIILKLCQVCFKGSHKFNTQEQGNKKHRVVEFLLNNKPLYRFKFECANNKIANRATAYQAIGFLFPGIYYKMVYELFISCDKFDLRAFENSQSTTKKDEVREKKQTNIYLKLFDCDITKIERFDKTSEMAGFKASGKKKDLDTSFSNKVESKMFSTLANTMLQKYAGRSLNFEVKLNKKVAASNSLEGDGKNQYTVTAADNQAAKYFSIVVECQNKMDAKMICGLKFIELHAEEVFKVIWEEVMGGQCYPGSAVHSHNTTSHIETSNFFSDHNEYEDLKKPLSKSPPGLPPITNASTGGGGDQDSKLSSFQYSREVYGLGDPFQVNGSLQIGQLSRHFRSDNDQTVSTVQASKPVRTGLRTNTPAFDPSEAVDVLHESVEDENEREDSMYQSIDRLHKKNIDVLLEEQDASHRFEENEEAQASLERSQPAENKHNYQFFGKFSGTREQAKPVDTRTIGKAINKQVSEKDASDEEEDSEDLSKDSDLKSSSGRDSRSEEDADLRSGQDSSQPAEDSFADSIDKLFDDYVRLNFDPTGSFDVSSFPAPLKVQVRSDWRGVSLIQSQFTMSINRVLQDNNMRICQYPLVRNESSCQIRAILETRAGADAEFSSIAYSDFVINTPKFELACNYVMFLVLKKTFPLLASAVKSKTLRDALGLDLAASKNNLLCNSFTGSRSSYTQHGREEDANMSMFAPPLAQQFVPPGGEEFTPSVKSTQPLLLNDSLSEFRPANTNSHQIKTVTESSVQGYNEELGTKSMVKAIELYCTKKTIIDKHRNTPLAEECMSWELLKGSFDEVFGVKLRTMECWELHAVYVHKDLEQKRSVGNYFENRIKRKEQFYSNIVKNLTDEDYASVANSLIHTIFKEPMNLHPDGPYTIFSLSDKRLVIIEARVQNIKLRKKLASMVILRLLWKEFYERCTTGDLARRDA